MNIKGFFNNKDQGIQIQSDSDHDASLYIGNHFTLTSNKDNTTLRTNELVLDSRIRMNDVNFSDEELIPTYLSMNKNGFVVLRKYKKPLYLLAGSFVYLIYHWFYYNFVNVKC